ncbi:MAG: hypothetical protein KY455_03830 [Euryarchaeota archaeon]|nr:hypothetical protein [Euryarchaeota archaeon]
MTDDTGPEPIETKRLLLAVGIALVVAGLVLVAAVLPAEYGIDPTGVGSLMGLDRLAGAGGTEGTGNGTDEEGTAQRASVLSFQATFNERAEELAAAEGYLSEGEEGVVELEVATTNVTRLSFRLSWQDDNATAGMSSKPDYFELAATAPDGTTYGPLLGRNVDGPDGEIVLDAHVSATPPTLVVEADSEEEAAAQVDGRHPVDATATGSWSVVVRMLDAGDVEVTGLGSDVDDDGDEWRLEANVTSYTLEGLTEVEEKKETVTISVPAGEGLEYKLLMDEGDRIEYAWETVDGEAVFFDFHGEPGPGPDFTSHASGTTAGDAGTFTAPFTGSHGWYFENQGEKTVTIVLSLEGVYETKGVV